MDLHSQGARKLAEVRIFDLDDGSGPQKEFRSLKDYKTNKEMQKKEALKEKLELKDQKIKSIQTALEWSRPAMLLLPDALPITTHEEQVQASRLQMLSFALGLDMSTEEVTNDPDDAMVRAEGGTPLETMGLSSASSEDDSNEFIPAALRDLDESMLERFMANPQLLEDIKVDGSDQIDERKLQALVNSWRSQG